MNDYTNLKSWIIENGGAVSDKVLLNTVNNIRGLYSTEKIEKDEVLCSLPQKCILNITEYDATLDEYNVNERFYKLCHLLATELYYDTDSFYYPYLKLLPSPEDLKSHPYLYFTLDDINLMAMHYPQVGTYLKNIYNKSNKLLTNYLMVDPLLPKYMHSLDFARYIVVLYHTRVWESYGFLPISDLANNTLNLSKSKLTFSCDEHFVKTSFSHEVANDVEINWMYNKNNVLMTYLNYGYVSQESQYLYYELNVGNVLPDNNELTSLKKKLMLNVLTNNQPSTAQLPNTITCCFADNKITVDIMGIFRALHLSEEDKNKPDINCLELISISNEFIVIKTLKKMFKSYLIEPNTELLKNARFTNLHEVLNNNNTFINKFITILNNYLISFTE